MTRRRGAALGDGGEEDELRVRRRHVPAGRLDLQGVRGGLLQLLVSAFPGDLHVSLLDEGLDHLLLVVTTRSAVHLPPGGSEGDVADLRGDLSSRGDFLRRFEDGIVLSFGSAFLAFC